MRPENGLFHFVSYLANDYVLDNISQFSAHGRTSPMCGRARILVQVTIFRRFLIGRDGHLDQSEAYDVSFEVNSQLKMASTFRICLACFQSI